MANEQAALSRTFGALSDRNRRAILARLERGSSSVSDLAKRLPIKLPAVLKHLEVLRRAGMVARSKEGRTVTVSLKGDGIRQAASWLTRYKKHF
jgi:DNA-binding transcriptional ArsR family regulator